MPLGALGTNCYILESESGECAIIDPGAHAQKIADEIEYRKITPRYILLTHGHYDHIGAAKMLRNQFAGVDIHIGEPDIEMITSSDLLGIAARGEDYIIDNSLAVNDGDEITLGELTIKAVATPGHTKGGICYVTDGVIFSGDTLFNGDIGRCDLYGGDYKVMLKSLKKLASLPGNYTVFPGHGDATNLDHERRTNQYINEALRD